MKDYKRLTFKRLVDPYDDDCEETENATAASYEELLNRLAELEDKLENGTLIQLPCVRKVKFAGFDCVEAVYIQHNGTIGECICLNETEAEKKLEEFKNETI